MSTTDTLAPPLEAGDWLSRDEFLERWEQHPEIKKAELIGGVVYMPPPVGIEHGYADTRTATWLGVYAAHTSGTQAGNNATWLMLGDAPQPDLFLHLDQDCGGSSSKDGKYLRGAPELAAEICHSSTAYDLHQKLDLYAAAGVKEYVTVLLREREVRWHRREGSQFVIVAPDASGVIRSSVFPGLWLDVNAFVDHDMRRVLAILQEGLQSDEHAAFTELLQQRRK